MRDVKGRISRLCIDGLVERSEAARFMNHAESNCYFERNENICDHTPYPAMSKLQMAIILCNCNNIAYALQH